MNASATCDELLNNSSAELLAESTGLQPKNVDMTHHNSWYSSAMTAGPIDTSAQLDLNASQFPLIVLTLNGDTNDALIDKMFIEYEVVMQRKLPYISITDVRGLTRLANARQRQEIAERLKTLEAVYGSYRKGSVLVLNSSAIRGALTAFYWILRKQQHERCAPDMAAALIAAQELAVAAGLTIPESARNLLVG